MTKPYFIRGPSADPKSVRRASIGLVMRRQRRYYTALSLTLSIREQGSERAVAAVSENCARLTAELASRRGRVTYCARIGASALDTARDAANRRAEADRRDEPHDEAIRADPRAASRAGRRRLPARPRRRAPAALDHARGCRAGLRPLRLCLPSGTRRAAE